MEQTPAFQQKTILVVDDQPELLRAVSGFLSATNEFVVLTATSGDDGLARSRAYMGDIALLLSDFQMPGMNGMELATAITLERPDIRVLLMSGFPAGMLVLNEGWHFLAKPFIPSQLRALVVGLVYPDRKSKF